MRPRRSHILNTEILITELQSTEKAIAVDQILREGEAGKALNTFPASPSQSLEETQNAEPKYVPPSAEVD